MDQFLTLPFRKSHLELQQQQSWRDSLYDIEWFIYNPSIHGQAFHGGLDRYVDYWTELYSPIDWYVMSSYNYSQCYQLTDWKHSWKARTYRWEKVSYGLWYAIQLYCPTRNIFLLFGHLSYIASSIPYIPPKSLKDDFWNDMWWCSWFALNKELREKIDQVPRAKKVRQWDYLWDVWLSWLYLWNELPSKEDVSDKPWRQIEHREFNYTAPHLHMNLFTRDDSWNKQTPIDPYDIYSTSDEYPLYWVDNWMKLWENHMFITWDDWLPIFVDELY